MKYTILAIILFSPAFLRGQQVLAYMGKDAVHLRWKGNHNQLVEGYNVYRKSSDADSWQLLTAIPLAFVSEQKKMEEILGFRSPLFHSLFNVEDGKPVSQKIVFDRFNTGDASLLEAICFIHPEFGKVLGEMYEDRTAIKGQRYTYRVTQLVSGLEKELASTSQLAPFAFQAIPRPAHLTATPGEEIIDLSWDKNAPAMQSGQVVSYTIYRSEKENGAFERINLANPLSVSVTSGSKQENKQQEQFHDAFLANGKTYYYQVRSVNAFGFESAPSNTASATPGPSAASLLPGNLEAKRMGSTVKISWTTPGARNATYELMRSHSAEGGYESVFFTTSDAHQLHWFDTKSTQGTDKYYYVAATSGNAKAMSDTIHVFFGDEIPPTAPTLLVATSGEGAVRLTWKKNPEHDVLGYEVERISDAGSLQPALLTSQPIASPEFSDKLPSADDHLYGYLVYAVDSSYNRSPASAVVWQRAIDHHAPASPSLEKLTEKDSTIILSWNAIIPGDFDTFIVYEWLPGGTNGMEVFRTTSLTAEIRSTGNASMCYTVVARDKSSNDSDHSGMLCSSSRKDKNTAPISNLTATLKGKNVQLNWNAPSDPELHGYTVTRIETKTKRRLEVAELGKNEPHYLDKYVMPGTEYRYEITAFNLQWRKSIPVAVVISTGK